MTPQAGTMNQTLEAKKVIARPISNILQAGANLAKALSVIPNIAPLCAYPEWALSALAGSAAAFGYSKPINDSNTTYVVVQPQRYAATSEGTDNAIPLAVSSQNTTLITKDLTPYDGDEMSMAFLLKVEASIAVGVPFLGAFVTGDHLCDSLTNDVRYISPRRMYSPGTKTVGVHTATFALGPPLNYISDSFALWRGSMILTFQFFKTVSHSARLQFTWIPHSGTIVDSTLTSSAYAIREIFDLSLADRFEVTLPWMLPYNFIDSASYSGKWNLIVLNAIVAPSVVSPDIYFNIYARGGDDLQFAAPYSVGTKIPFSLQSGLNVGKIANEGEDTATLLPNMESTGECISSVRQLLNRYTFNSSTTYPATSGALVQYWPYHSGISWMTPITGVQNASNFGGDLYSLISQMYCMYKGSMNVMISINNASNGCFSYIEPNFASGSILQIGAADLFNITNWYLGGSPVGMGVNFDSVNDLRPRFFQVPYACRTRASLHLNQSINNNIPVEPTQPMNVLKMSAMNVVVAGNTVRTARRIGEDFQFSYFVGCVPRLISYT